MHTNVQQYFIKNKPKPFPAAINTKHRGKNRPDAQILRRFKGFHRLNDGEERLSETAGA